MVPTGVARRFMCSLVVHGSGEGKKEGRGGYEEDGVEGRYGI